jgi:hypothetical protein
MRFMSGKAQTEVDEAFVNCQFHSLRRFIWAFLDGVLRKISTNENCSR